MSLSLSISNFSPPLDKKSSEVAVIAQALHNAAHDIQAAQGNVTSGNILAPGGAVIGSWTYAPQGSLP